MSDKESILDRQLDDVKLAAAGEVRDKVFDQPIQLPRVPTEPTPMLYQLPYYLSEADFEKIRRPSGSLNAIGWACITLAVTNTVRLIVKLSESQFSEPFVSASKTEVITTGLIVCAGAIFLVLSSVFSRAKKRLLKEIDTHFTRNRPKLELRLDRPNDK